MEERAFEPSLSETAPAQPDIPGNSQDTRDAALHLLYREVQRQRQLVLFNQERIDELTEALHKQAERTTAMACAEEIMRRAVGGNGMGGKPEPKHRRECPKGWRVIDGGAKAAVPVLAALAAVGVVLLVIAGGAVAVPSMRDGFSAQAATRPHARPLIRPAHFVNASPPPLLPPRQVRRCHDRDGDVTAVLLADERRACRDRDAGQDTQAAAAAVPARSSSSPAVTPSPSRSSTPPATQPSPSPTTALPGSTPAATPPPSPSPTGAVVVPGGPDDGQ